MLPCCNPSDRDSLCSLLEGLGCCCHAAIPQTGTVCVLSLKDLAVVVMLQSFRQGQFVFFPRRTWLLLSCCNPSDSDSLCSLLEGLGCCCHAAIPQTATVCVLSSKDLVVVVMLQSLRQRQFVFSPRRTWLLLSCCNPSDRDSLCSLLEGILEILVCFIE